MNQSLHLIYQSSFLQLLANLKLLIVGVGGIGCQLLKSLIHFSFNSIHIIDLDTIELTNLNRQILFRKQHKGHSKAKIAQQMILKFRPQKQIIAHHCNIRSKPFSFFKQFKVVLLALDNIQTRIYVNNICMRLNIPLIDAGTSGFIGQAYLVKRFQTRCYSCFNKENLQPKTYPACTIRNRPQKVIHCIIWAKYLFEAFFGTNNQENLLTDLKQKIQFQGSVLGSKECIFVFNQLFYNHIVNFMTQENGLYENSIQPLKEQKIDLNNQLIQNENLFEEILSLQQSKTVFYIKLRELYQRKQKEGMILFDKDDQQIILFIMAASNIRCHIFGIQKQNYFKVKQKVSNIIPAISSTNSIVSGIEIIQFLKYLAWQFYNKSKFDFREYYVQNLSDKKIIKNKDILPNPDCNVCSLKHQPLMIQLNFQITKLLDLKEFIQKKIELKQFSLSCGNIQLLSVYELEQDQEVNSEYSQKLNKPLSIFLKNPIQSIGVFDQNAGKILFFMFLIHQKEVQSFHILNNQMLETIIEQKICNDDGQQKNAQITQEEQVQIQQLSDIKKQVPQDQQQIKREIKYS